jgi:hypothetical protein
MRERRTPVRKPAFRSGRGDRAATSDALIVLLTLFRLDALFVAASPVLHGDRGRIIELAARYRLPAIYQ